MKVLACENNSSGTSSPFMVTDCLGKWFTGINVADSESEKITQEEQSSLIRRQIVRRNYSEQMTEKQNSVKTCSKTSKKETPTIYGSRCSCDLKRKTYPYEVGMNRLKSYKSRNLLLWQFILSKPFSTSATRFFQQPTYSTPGEILNQNPRTLRFQWSTLSKLNSFSFSRKVQLK